MLNVSKTFLVFLLCLNQQVCVIQEQVSFGDVTWFNRATFAMHLALKKKKKKGGVRKSDVISVMTQTLEWLIFFQSLAKMSDRMQKS